MSDKTSESSANYILLTRLADEFAARYRAGERPPLQEYIDRYPELADDIRELFPAMVEIEQVREDHQEADAHAAAPPSPALQQLGDYRILREVGKGGMGIVYEAEQVSLGRHVALKVLPTSMLLDVRAKRRFEREAKVGRQAAPHQYRPRLRRRRAGWLAVLRHAVHPGPGAGCGAGRAEETASTPRRYRPAAGSTRDRGADPAYRVGDVETSRLSRRWPARC